MLNTDDLRYYTGIGTGYTAEAMLKRAADEIDRLRASKKKSSWEGQVDRQGGSFTQEEIDNATAWR